MRVLPTRSSEQGAETSFMSPFRPNQQSWCGHSIDVNRPPRTNCNHCWSFFFMQDVEFTKAVANSITTPTGRQTITRLYGDKFLKKAKLFFAEIAAQQKRIDLINSQIEAEQLVDTRIDLVIPSVPEGYTTGLDVGSGDSTEGIAVLDMEESA